MATGPNIYSIGEVAEITGFKPYVIRYYEKEFELNIPREGNNRRSFTDKELRQFLYIKELQDKGISNKEIKEIIKNNQVNVKNNIENQISITDITDPVSVKKKTIDETYIDETFNQIKNELIAYLEKYDYRNEINELREKIEELRQELVVKDQDVLLCENAKLKLKLKEKSYEVAELKDKLKRQEYQKQSMFQRLLRTKNAT